MKHVFGMGHGGTNTHLRESGSVFGGVGEVVLDDVRRVCWRADAKLAREAAAELGDVHAGMRPANVHLKGSRSVGCLNLASLNLCCITSLKIILLPSKNRADALVSKPSTRTKW
jgi:hypothetical protein